MDWRVASWLGLCQSTIAPLDHVGGAYRGAYVRRGVGMGVGAAAVGAVSDRPAFLGYYPSPPCY
jgi:hypothetical protein